MKKVIIFLLYLSCTLLIHINHARFFTAATPTILPFTNQADKLGLVAIKSEIQSDPFEVLHSWNDSQHFCKWQGISCSPKHQRVTVLRLPNLNLEGTLSSHIANLSFLRVLNLNGNKFHGNVPQQIGRLFRLQHLILNNNLFEGVIPASIFNCSELRNIQLHRNNLGGDIPAGISSLPKLSALSLANNQFSGIIPPSLGNLTGLTNLSLATNNLKGSIPLELGQLSNLQFLDFRNNNLSGELPSSLFNKSSLLSFLVSNNSLSGQLPLNFGLTLPKLQNISLPGNLFFGPIPSTLVNASSLRNIDFTQNAFTGPVPSDLGMLQDLETLQLSYNSLGTYNGIDDLGFIRNLTNCTKLRMLIVGGNGLNGALPVSIANLTAGLTFLGLRENSIIGNIPEGIGNLINLIYLGLSDNKLSGVIPDSIGKLKKLQALYLHNNTLSGNIPSPVGNLSDVIFFSLWANLLEGTIPVSLGGCRRLMEIDLSENKLNGTIPVQLITAAPSTLYGLYLSQNQLTGPLPLQVGSLSSLGRLYLYKNKLSGEIPTSLGDCLMLELVDMSGNFFEGSIPSSFRKLNSTYLLDLSGNNLSGQIPGFLGEIKSLINLNLSFNKLYGEVPTEGVFSNAKNFSVSGNKMLCGGIRQLQLPPCPAQAEEKHKNNNRPKVVIGIICAIVGAIMLSACICGALFYWKRRPKQAPASKLQLHPEFTYAELHQATDGFSSANLIGKGSFGSVYKGTIRNPEEKAVAVKVFNLQERGANKCFLAECEALKNIRHRNLVKIISSCSSINFQGDDFKALVYEFMPNGSLDGWLHPSPQLELQESKSLNLIQRLNIAIDVAAGLDYLHNQCHTMVVHCDLKPSNILLDDDLTAHVGDFGLARLLFAASSWLQTGSTGLRGTIGYAAPEYGIGTKPSARGDTYSYGILLLELLTGKRPTDHIFTEGLSLHGYVNMALPNNVMQIIDPQLTSLEAEGESSSGGGRSAERSNVRQIEQCMVSVLRIGVLCSAELPGERMDIQDALKEFYMIKKTFFCRS